MLKAQSTETCRNIRSVHIALVAYRYITPTHFIFNSMALVISMGLFIILDVKNLTQKPHQIAALSNVDLRFFPRY